METSLSLLVLRTSRVDAMLSLYRAMGLRFKQEQHGSGPVHYSCDFGNAVLEIYPGNSGDAPSRQSGGATSLGFRVSSVDGTLSEIQKLGAPVISVPKNSQWGCRATVADPDGRTIEIS